MFLIHMLLLWKHLANLKMFNGDIYVHVSIFGDALKLYDKLFNLFVNQGEEFLSMKSSVSLSWFNYINI